MKKILDKKFYIILAVILVLHALILLRLIYFPYPELFIYPYLTNIGLKPYMQILDQHFPGLLFLPINFNNLGMSTPEIARIWSIVLVVINQILLFIVGKKLLGSPARALLVNVLYLIWQPFLEGWVLWIDNFLPLFLLPAFYFFLEKRIFLTGLFLGIAVVSKQTVLPLSGFVFIYLLWRTKSLKVSITYLVGLLIPVILTLIYLISIGVLGDFWYWTIVFNLTIFSKFGTKGPPIIGFVTRALLIFGSAFFVFLLSRKKHVPILLIFLAGSLVGIFDRADFVHFQPALPFAILATTTIFFDFFKDIKFKAFTSAYILIALWWLVIFYKGHLGDYVYFGDSQTKKIAVELRKLTSPNEKIFVFGAVPSLYQMTDTRPAGDIFVFQFPWFLQIAQDRVLEGIKRDRPKIIVSDREGLIEGVKISDFAKDIDQYINQNYQTIDSIGEIKILRRSTN